MVGRGRFGSPAEIGGGRDGCDAHLSMGDVNGEGLDKHAADVTLLLTDVNCDVSDMITAAQLRAARALLGIDQRALADLAGLSVPTIQRMEASDGVVRGTVDSLTKLVAALDAAGVELIGEGAMSSGGGRGIRLRSA